MMDHAVSRAVMQSRLLERALHSPGPWQIEINGERFDALKNIGEDRVSFTAQVPPACFLLHCLPDVMSLIDSGYECSSRRFECPGEGGFRVEWEFRLVETANK